MWLRVPLPSSHHTVAACGPGGHLNMCGQPFQGFGCYVEQDGHWTGEFFLCFTENAPNILQGEETEEKSLG